MELIYKNDSNIGVTTTTFMAILIIFKRLTMLTQIKNQNRWVSPHSEQSS